MSKINVAVDGTAGSGKTFIFQKVADQVNYELIDTGLMYRAFTYHVFLNKIDFSNRDAVLESLKTFEIKMKNRSVFLANNLDVTDKLSTNSVIENINKITIIPEVRNYMVALQRELGNRPGVIEVGRDITSLVLPDADLKIYLDAPVEVRAQRRFDQNKTQGINDSLEVVLEKIRARDQTDLNREVGPLVQTSDSWYIDSNLLPVDQLIKEIVEKIRTLEEEK